MVPRLSRASTATPRLPIFSRTTYPSQTIRIHQTLQGMFLPISPDSQLTSPSLCKSLIRKLLIKDELRRLGSRAGASDVKAHPFFRSTSWALLRHMKPPMVPHAGRGIDTVNFRNVKESHSVDISSSKIKGVPLDSGLATPVGEVVDPFGEFNSVTLHHDGDDHSQQEMHHR